MNGSVSHEASPWKSGAKHVNPDTSLSHYDMNEHIRDYDEEEAASEIGTKKRIKEVNVPVLVTLLILGIIAVFVFIACLVSAIHRVDEGHVGLYFRHGALIDELGEPGIQWAQPFVTRVEYLMIRPETKVLDPMVCTTQDGVRNVFRDVQVISSIKRDKVLGLVREFGVKLKDILIYDRVTEAMQLFCSNHSIDEVYNTKFLDIIDFVTVTLEENLQVFAPDSIQIWNVFLPKPDVPPAIAANYREVKIEWTKQLVAQQRQKTEQIEKETQKIKAILDAERKKAVEGIDISRRIQQEEGRKNISSINNEIFMEKMKNEADASSYVSESEAKSNELLLTDQYIRLNVAKSLMNNTKMYFSGAESAVGTALADIFGRASDRN